MSAGPWRGAGATRHNRGLAAQRRLRTARSREAGPGGSSGGRLSTWPSGFGGWMPPWWSGGHPRGTAGPGPAQGRRATTPWCFPCSHRPRPPEPANNPPEGVCCAGSITGQANPSQTSEHQRRAALSCVPPLPSRPPGSFPTSTCPALAPQRRDVPSVSPQPCCHLLRCLWHPRARRDAGQALPRAVLAAATWDGRAEEQHPPPVGRGTRALRRQHRDSRVG